MNRMRLIMVACMALWGAGAWACSFVSAPSWSLGNYGPSQDQSFAQPLSVRIAAGRGCAAELQVEWAGNSGEVPLQGPDAAPLRVAMSLDGAGVAPLGVAPVAAANVAIGAGQEFVITLWGRPYSNQWLAPGQYAANLRLRLVGAGGTLAQQDVRVSLNVDASVRAAYSGGAGKLARFDFGELMQGATRQATLDVQANVGYQLRVSSAYRGRLVNSRFKEAVVPYQIFVDGIGLPLGTGNGALDVATAGLQHHRIQAEIGAVERVLAGEYADALLITITAK